MAKLERDVSKACKDVFKRFPGVKAIRVHSGSVKVKYGYMQLAEAGTSDFICCVEGGRFLGVETKKDDAIGTTGIKTREAQRKFKEEVEALGGTVIQVSSAEQLVVELQKFTGRGPV